jgi:hypothetical protein
MVLEKCEHNHYTRQCRICHGKDICSHDRRHYECISCNPHKFLYKLHRNAVNFCYYKINKERDKDHLHLLGLESSEQLYDYLKSKMTEDMDFNNNDIAIDHIKPKSRFDLNNEEELKKCLHYTNLQPMLKKNNSKKYNKWTNKDEEFWNENIIFNPSYKNIYFPINY